MPGARVELAWPCLTNREILRFSQKFPFGSDYLISHEGIWALMRDYCWGSPSSLYTFRETNALRGSARDCLMALPLRFPRIHPVYFLHVAMKETHFSQVSCVYHSTTRAELKHSIVLLLLHPLVVAIHCNAFFCFLGKEMQFST